MPLKFKALPYVASELPKTGGRIKDKPEHFVVEEIPLYEASGQGPHLYLTLKRRGLTTRQVVDDLARLFNQPPAAVGYAGLKDKDAVTIQTFSIPTDMSDDEARGRCGQAPWQLLGLARHRNKIKVGHLLGNRFTIVLSEPEAGLAEASAIAGQLRARGLPNYFGGQRFGKDGDNAEAGLALVLKGRPGKSWKDKFLLSALQSHVFNYYLALRLEEGLFEKVLTGDVCKKYATGGLFVSEDGALESRRLEAGELTHAGPIFGEKMKAAESEAAELEARVLAEMELKPELMAKCGAGDRRANRLLLPDLTVEEGEEGLVFTFALPKGAYATSVMREFIRPEES